ACTDVRQNQGRAVPCVRAPQEGFVQLTSYRSPQGGWMLALVLDARDQRGQPVQEVQAGIPGDLAEQDVRVLGCLLAVRQRVFDAIHERPARVFAVMDALDQEMIEAATQVLVCHGLPSGNRSNTRARLTSRLTNPRASEPARVLRTADR